MDEEKMFNQKLKEIGGGELLEGISIRGKDANKILDFINANAAYEYNLDNNNMLKRVDDNLKNNNNLDKNAETFLDMEIQSVLNSKSKIVLAFSQEAINGDLEKFINGESRIILLNEDSYTVSERYSDYIDSHDNSIVITRDNLFNEALSDRLIKSMHDNTIIMTRSSTEIMGRMNAATNVYHGPSEKHYAVVGSVDLNEQVYILASSRGWYHIQYRVTATSQQKTGYVPEDLVGAISAGIITEEDFYGGFCFATTELDVRTCDDFSLTAPVGTLFKHEGCTFLFSYMFNGENIAFIEYSTSSGTKRGYVYSKYLTFPLETIVGIVNQDKVDVYGGPGDNYANIGTLGGGELISLLAKESDNIYVEYNTTGGRKRGYIKWNQINPRDYVQGTMFADFYKNGNVAHIIPQRCVVYAGPNSNYAELGAVNNENVTCFNTNKEDTNQYTFEYTCIEYVVSSTGKLKRGYVLASQVISGNLPEENNPIESFNDSYSYFGSKINYGTTQKGRNMFYYKCGSGKNHLFLIFAQHGWEDGTKSDGSLYHGDGNMLLKVAKQFMIRFANLSGSRIDNIRKKWTIYVFPGINLDGIVNGNSKDGFGRCFKNGIDPNRSWPGHFKVFTEPRNYTGSSYLGAQELVNLKKVLVDNRGSGDNVLLDVHCWENSFLSDSTALSNYFMSELKQLNSGFRYKDTTGSTTDNGYLIRWAHNATNLATSSSEMAGLGATSGLLEFPPTKDYSDTNMNRYAEKFFNGTVNLLEKMNVSIPDPYQELYDKLTTLYNLANEYKSNGSVKEKNNLVLQYLRHKDYNKDHYDGNFLSKFQFDYLYGDVDEDFVSFVQSRVGDEYDPNNIKVPEIGFDDIKISHLAATINGFTHGNLFDAEHNALGGWAGDLLQLGGNLTDKNAALTSDDAYKLIGGANNAVANKYGFSTVTLAGFGYEDWTHDIDAVNLYLNINNGIRIDDVFREYYSTSAYNQRYKVFIERTIPGGVINKDSMYEYVHKYTSLAGMATATVFGAAFGYFGKYADELATGFVNKLWDYYENE